jgi:DNA replication protein DnaC
VARRTETFLVEAIGLSACTRGYRVRYITSAKLLRDLTASLADQTLPRRVRYWAHFEALIIGEFGFERRFPWSWDRAKKESQW